MLILLINLFGIFGCVVIANWIKKVRQGRVSRSNISFNFFILSLLIVEVMIFGIYTDYFKSETSPVFLAAMATIFLITAIDVKITPCQELIEEAKEWKKWLISLLTITYLITLLMDYSKQRKNLK